jgi:hydroxypyruvate isomerase
MEEREVMLTHFLRYEVNCSLLFTELPVLERPAAVKAAGFDAVEFWWPWAEAVPGDAEVDAFVAAIKDAGVQLVGLNFYAGDLAGPDAGLVSLPKRSQEFRDNVAVTVGIGEQLGCRAFNALYGVRVDDITLDEQHGLATENLAIAASSAARIGGVVLIESVSGPKPYPLRTAADAIAVVERLTSETGVDNVRFLADLYHLATNGDDIKKAITTYAAQIGHVQIADAPGRGEPGTGELDIDGYLTQLQAAGYDGWVGLEYKPSGTTADSFGWLPAERRSASV